jgi:type I restriction enzyme S subunit
MSPRRRTSASRSASGVNRTAGALGHIEAPEPSALPPGWRWSTLGEIADLPVDQSGPGDEHFTYIDISAIDNKGKRIVGPRHVATVDAPSRARQRVRPGDVLVSMTRPNLNAVALVPPELEGAIASTGFHVLRTDQVDPRWMFYLVQSSAFVEAMSATVQGALYPAVRPKDIRAYAVRVPPIQEQRAIVEMLDELLSILEAASSELERSLSSTARYRACAYASAVRGGTPSDPSTILAPLAPEGFDLPEGWYWSTLGAHLDGIETGKSFKCDERPPVEGETGVVKVSAVTWGTYDERESKTVREAARIDDGLLVRPGDFLFSRANTIQLVGACVIAERVTRRIMLSDKILRFRLRNVDPRWVLVCLRSDWGRREIERLATGNQESMRNIGQDRIRAIRIPIPPPSAQVALVESVAQRVDGADRLSAVIQTQLARSQRLRLAVLQQALVGDLAPLANRENRAVRRADSSSVQNMPRLERDEVAAG